MSRMPFYVSLRKGYGYYVSFRSLDTGEPTTKQSVEKVRERLQGNNEYLPITKRKQAERYCTLALEQNVAFKNNSTDKGYNITLDEYVLSFWNYETSEYILRRNNLKPNSISKRYTLDMISAYKNHAKKLLPKNIKLNKIKTIHLQKVIDTTLKEFAPSTVNKISLALSTPLNEAFRLGLINNDPSIKLTKIPNYVIKKRDILSNQETNSLLKEIRKLFKDTEISASQYYAILLGLYSGMRLGEIRALNINDIIINNNIAKINIKHSLDYQNKIKCTKGKENRTINIHIKLATELINLGSINPLATGTIIWSNKQDKSNSGYVSTRYIERGFYKALYNIGINEQTRKDRGLVFHSLRHMYLTMICDDKGLIVAQQLAGHKQATTTLNYHHVTDEYRKQGYEAINNIIPFQAIS